MLQRRWLVAAGLVALTFAIYAPVRSHRFLKYDDQVSIVENPNLAAGLSWASVARAFHTPRFYNWIPLTAVSLQIDHALYGLEPAGYLLTNVALHAATSAVLFLALLALTGAAGPSAFVAAVFAVHPLHVESVAWATERKDVLSGLFFALGLWAWSGYTRRPGPLRYAAVAGAFALGLLAKPSIVTFPFVLLLLDWWPLRRLCDRASLGRLVLEKLPLLAIACLAAAVTYLVQQAAGGVTTETALPFSYRLGNALESYVVYVRQSLWPSGLAVFYPHPRADVSLAGAALAGAGLAALTAAVLRAGRERGYLAVGWLWYLGMLVPVIGLVQAGMQARADRYMYWPLAGLAIAVAWGAAALATGRPRLRRALPLAGLAAVAALGIAASLQLRSWRDTEALFTRALAVTERNFVAHAELGLVAAESGRSDEALRHYEAAIRFNPRWAPARTGLGDAYLERGGPGDREAAVAAYRAALELAPDDAHAHTQLAKALALGGDRRRAAEHLRRALAARPDTGVDVIEANLGAVLLELGEDEEAVRHLERALALDPDQATAHAQLGLALARAGSEQQARLHLERALALGADSAELRATLARLEAERGSWAAAAEHQRAALALRPGSVAAANNLAWLLATCPDPRVRAPDEAVALVEGALAASGARDAALLDTLAAAHAAAGRFPRAVRLAEEALAGASPDLAPGIAERLALYRSGRPYLQTASG